MKTIRSKLPFLLIVIAGIYAVIMLVANGFFEGSKRVEAEGMTAYINDEPVTTKEFRLMFNKLRDKDDSLHALIRIKVTQIEAVQQGILSTADYSSFLDDWNKENAKRREALNDRETIFGPKSYSEQNYYDYRYANTVNRLKSQLFETKFSVTDQRLQDYFQRNIESFGKRHDRIELEKITIPILANDILAYGEARRASLEKMNVIVRKLSEGIPFEELYSDQVRDIGRSETEIIDEENYREVSKYRNSVYQTALRLEPGAVSPLIEEGEGFLLFRVVSRKGGGYKTFEESRGEVTQRYMDETFDAYIDKLVSEAVVELLPSYGAFNK